MKKFKTILLYFLSSALAFAAAAQEQYCNQRYGYCLSYPGALLHPQPEAMNGDGRVFVNTAGEERLRVYGTSHLDANGREIPFRRLYEMELKGGRFPDPAHPRKLSYQVFKGHYFVVSGTEKGRTFYLKVILGNEAFLYALLVYPPAEQAVYGPVATQLLKEFRKI